jgi:hypothetical protein
MHVQQVHASGTKCIIHTHLRQPFCNRLCRLRPRPTPCRIATCAALPRRCRICVYAWERLPMHIPLPHFVPLPKTCRASTGPRTPDTQALSAEPSTHNQLAKDRPNHRQIVLISPLLSTRPQHLVVPPRPTYYRLWLRFRSRRIRGIILRRGNDQPRPVEFTAASRFVKEHAQDVSEWQVLQSGADRIRTWIVDTTTVDLDANLGGQFAMTDTSSSSFASAPCSSS